MKKLMRYLLVLVLTLAMMLTSTSCDLISDLLGGDGGLEYALSSDGRSYAVVGIGDFKGTDLVIPEKYRGRRVTEICTEAFYYCRELTSITIPDSITTFGEYFLPVEEFDKLELNEYDNANYIGNENNPYLVLVKAKSTDITSCTIHPDTRVISYGAFSSCKALTKITVPEGVTHIMAMAFYGCESLGDLHLPKSLDYLGENALKECNSLTYSTLGGATYFGTQESPLLILVSVGETDVQRFAVPDGTKFIGDNAFYECTSLKEVSLPDNIRNIGSCAFSGCTNLDKISLPDGLGGIGRGAFGGCAFKTVTIPDSVTYMGQGAFRLCASLESVVLGNGLKSVYYDMFYSCAALESVTFPEYLVSIKQSAFMGCHSLDNVLLPNSVKEIGQHAFLNCYNLRKLHISSSIESIASGAFANCDSIAYNTYDNAKYLGNDDDPYIVLFEALGTNITSCKINSDTRIIFENAFKGCEFLTSIDIPDSVVAINYSAFQDCKSLESVSFGKNVEVIGSSAFSGCSSLESLILSDSLLRIQDAAFYGCEELTSITFGKNLESIGAKAFGECPNLEKVVIPKSVKNLGAYVFDYIPSFTIYCEAKSQPDGWNYYWNAYECEVIWGYKG